MAIQIGGTTVIDNSRSLDVGIATITSLTLGGKTVSTLGVGIKTSGSFVGYGATLLDFRGSGISTVTVGSGIATVNIPTPTVPPVAGMISVGDVDNLFGYVSAAATITQNVTFNQTNAGSNSSYVLSFVPIITIAPGVTVTVGTGKTMIFNALGLTTYF